MSKPIYNLQRFQILHTKLNPQTTNLISDAYAYAWYHNLYPLGDDSNLHKDIKEHFDILESEISNVLGFADEQWRARRFLTFYNYEDHYRPNLNIDRMKLKHILRYAFLKDLFDEEFWRVLLTPSEYPMEASNITRNFQSNELYLI
jgi:hypothetical protein